MSHVTTVQVMIESLESLEMAANSLGLEFVRDKTSYKWYGHHVGDYPIPDGFKESDLGKCEHVIRVPGSETAYEIGVVKRRDGKPGWTMIYDFWGSCGREIEQKAGERCSALAKQYTKTHVIRGAIARGLKVEERQVNGKTRLVLRG